MKCKKCTYYDAENEFCYYYLLQGTELFDLNRGKCSHWKRRIK